eukprot:CAMPEP_0171220150 /NCGR_PEP_ID=MMETSP0790-20130122/34088_1 /TAXON_ID=2925 /ORGANISM="Alexandrium catenella, Strain OF101" /LENGTH=372 /DNA_ID=CAMNT_0011686033 /DNA_START=72 /DNA_END=1190 /DNA_ORIENTATION=+
MSSEADEHERALALEMSFQRRQWEKMTKLEKLVEEQAFKLTDLERRLLEQAERARAADERLELQRQEVQANTSGLSERCTEEREARQTELHALRLSLKSLESRCEELVREATKDLSPSIHKAHVELKSSHEGLQRRHDELSRDLAARCKDLEHLLAEERAGRVQELKGLQAFLSSLQAAHDEVERGSSFDRDVRRQEQQELRTSLANVEHKCSEMIRDTTKDLTKLISTKNQECAELVRDFGGRCKELGREAAEDRETRAREHQGIRATLGELERQCGQLVRDIAEEVGEKHIASSVRAGEVEKRCGMALKELAIRVDEVEHNLATHTHQFTSSKTYKCGLAMMPSAQISCARGGLQHDGLSTISTIAGSEA